MNQISVNIFLFFSQSHVHRAQLCCHLLDENKETSSMDVMQQAPVLYFTTTRPASEVKHA